MGRVHEMQERWPNSDYRPRRNGGARHCGVMMRNTGLPTLESLGAVDYRSGPVKSDAEIKKIADATWAKTQQNLKYLEEQRAKRASGGKIERAGYQVPTSEGGGDFFDTVGKIITQTASELRRTNEREQPKPAVITQVAQTPPAPKPQSKQPPWLWIAGGLAAFLAIGGIVIVATRKKR